MQLFDKTIHSRILYPYNLRLYYISFRLKAGAQGSYVHKVMTPMHYKSCKFCPTTFYVTRHTASWSSRYQQIPSPVVYARKRRSKCVTRKWPTISNALKYYSSSGRFKKIGEKGSFTLVLPRDCRHQGPGFLLEDSFQTEGSYKQVNFNLACSTGAWYVFTTEGNVVANWKCE